MHRHRTRPRLPGRLLPECEPGLTVLQTPHHRSGALYQVALQVIRGCDGPAYWLDARNTASTYALRDCTDREQLLRRVHLAHEILDEYDGDFYTSLAMRAGETVLSPLGWTPDPMCQHLRGTTTQTLASYW